MMTRQTIEYPETQESWNKLPQEFVNYLDVLDKEKWKKSKSMKVDSLYPTYDYEWELDERIAFETILYYWNQVDKQLPSTDKLLDYINEGYCEAAYDEYVSSAYSY